MDEEDVLYPRCERGFFIQNGVAHSIDPQGLEVFHYSFARFYDWLSPVYALFIKAAFLPFGEELKFK